VMNEPSVLIRYYVVAEVPLVGTGLIFWPGVNVIVELDSRRKLLLFFSRKVKAIKTHLISLHGIH
jgi:hypothetical protein